MGKFTVSRATESNVGNIGKGFSAITSFLGADNFSDAGDARQGALDSQAEQLDQLAGVKVPIAQRKAAAIRKQTNLLKSGNQAKIAASGTRGDSPDFINAQAAVEGEGEYAAQIALYEGKTQQQQLEFAASNKRYSGELARIAGNQQKKAARIKAVTTLLSGAGKNMTLASKYGPLDDLDTDEISMPEGELGFWDKVGGLWS
jgi:hypothetical protein